jgi:hypothetical protein
MGGAIRFDGPTGQQQSQNDTKNQLFLFRQAIHITNIAETKQTATIPFTIFDLRFKIGKWFLGENHKSRIANYKFPCLPLADFRRAAKSFTPK